MHPVQPNTQRTATAVLTDVQLARSAQGGDDQAFETIMRRHNQLLFRTARSILKNDADTEDALQDAYIKSWRTLSSFREEARLSTWLVRIVVNEALGRLRRRAAQVIPLDFAIGSHEPSDESATQEDDVDLRPDTLAMRAEMRQLMESRIDRLPDLYRTVFMLRAVEELSVDEVSDALDISAATVRIRFFRARSLLREGLSRDIDLAVGDAFSFASGRCDRIVAGVLQRISNEREIPRT